MKKLSFRWTNRSYSHTSVDEEMKTIKKLLLLGLYGLEP